MGMEEDHPRSRGVYGLVGVADAALHGSSPLARGLRLPAAAGRGGGGIIPARAGFTCFVAARVSFVRDHPRSRGVYLTLSWRGTSR